MESVERSHWLAFLCNSKSRHTLLRFPQKSRVGLRNRRDRISRKDKYPVVCQTETGHVRFDNFEGRWGEQSWLDAFHQAYAVERAKIEARTKGHTVTEQQLADGSIKLTVQVNGGAA